MSNRKTSDSCLTEDAVRVETRRQFFARGARGLGVAALARRQLSGQLVGWTWMVDSRDCLTLLPEPREPFISIWWGHLPRWRPLTTSR